MTSDELKALCGSNARAIQATNEGIGELRNTVTAFLQRVDEGGLQVRLITEISDDQAGELTSLGERAEATDLGLNNLRADAIADRLEFREQAEADRQTFKEEMQAAREASERRFKAQLEEIRAQGEQIRALISALASTNGRVDSLERNAG